MLRVCIVTGPDLMGKTWMSTRLDGQYVKLHNPDQQTREQNLAWAIAERDAWIREQNGSWKQLIYDRFPYPDEAIYGYMSDFEKDWFWQSIFPADVIGAFVVVMPAFLDVYKQRLAESRDAHLVGYADQIVAGYKAWVQQLEQRDIPLMKLTLPEMTCLHHVQEVNSWLRSLQ